MCGDDAAFLSNYFDRLFNCLALLVSLSDRKGYVWSVESCFNYAHRFLLWILSNQ